MSSKNLDFASQAVFYEPEEHSQSISYPIYMSANFQYGGDIYAQIMAGARTEGSV